MGVGVPSVKRISIVAVLSALVATAIACTSFSSDPPPEAPSDGGKEDAQADTSAPGADAADRDAATDGPQRSSAIGCSDNTVEGFVGSPNIAACEGAWVVAGIIAKAPVTCQRMAGNSSSNPSGAECSSQDLCAEGWHVCTDGADVASHGGTIKGGICSLPPVDGGTLFYATAQPSKDTAACSSLAADVNDVFGCGDVTRPGSSCTPLNAVIGTFVPLDPFNLGGDNDKERENVKKAAGPGGVLCCRD